MTASDIIRDIMKGDADDNLDGVLAAIRDRRQLAGRAAFHTLRAGDKVRLQNLRPKYLIGMTATVIRKNNTRIVVTLDEAPPGARFHGEINALPSMLEKIEDAPPKKAAPRKRRTA